MDESTLQIAVIGAGPVGLALALQAARALPAAGVTLFDARAADKDVSGDPRTLALSLGSVQLLERLGAWRAERAQPILEVHVSQQAPSMPVLWGGLFGEPCLRIRAIDEAVPLLGAVLSYGAIVAPLQQVWMAAQAAEPKRLHSRFGEPVAALKNLERGVEVDAGIAERFDLAIVAEGGVFADQARKAVAHDYRQTAWVGRVGFDETCGRRERGVAFERFTRHGPAALLPLKDGGAGLVWCVPSDDDPVRELDDAQRVAVLNSIFHPDTGRIASISPLKPFALGLNAERTLADGRTVRIGNAAQTLHPVAGQGLNLGLRDAFELVQALSRHHDVDAVLRRLEWQRGPDRWAMIAATDFLARSFTWKLPGAGAARGLGIAALQALGPVRSALARQMMFGSR
ncbi:MAG: FAD-dependent monooxygenase [Burkholderiales bacterium]|nr:FAD-dependent monooxygenase [Burkholderiales bacterium]